MAPGASALEEVSSRYSGREGGGDPQWGCGWGGGQGSGVHIGGWREGELLSRLHEPSRGPRTVGVEGSRPERLVFVQRRGGPGSRRPAPGGLLPGPSYWAARGRPQLCLPGCGGNTSAGCTGPSPEDPPKKDRGGLVSAEVRPLIPVRGSLSFAQPFWQESPTSRVASASPSSKPPNLLAG